MASPPAAASADGSGDTDSDGRPRAGPLYSGWTHHVAAGTYANLPERADFQLLYVDPPWQHTARGSAISCRLDTQYAGGTQKTRTLNELAAYLGTQATAPDCVLLLWATSPLIQQAYDFIDATRTFSPRGVLLTMEKRRESTRRPIMGLGMHTRTSVEWLLYAQKGRGLPLCDGAPATLRALARPGAPDTSVQPLVYSSVVGKSTRKPDDVYALIERSYGRAPAMLELFARAQRWPWWSWGDETTRNGHADALYTADQWRERIRVARAYGQCVREHDGHTFEAYTCAGTAFAHRALARARVPAAAAEDGTQAAGLPVDS